MYDEDSYKATLFWLKIRKIFIVLFFTIVCFTIGFVVSEFLVDILLLSNFIRIVCIAGSAILGFMIGFVLTADTEYKIQAGYYNIAVLRKLSIISKKLDKFDEENISKEINHTNIKNNEINEKMKEIRSNFLDGNSNTIEISSVSPLSENQNENNN